jgi:hypothetical protein
LFTRSRGLAVAARYRPEFEQHSWTPFRVFSDQVWRRIKCRKNARAGRHPQFLNCRGGGDSFAGHSMIASEDSMRSIGISIAAVLLAFNALGQSAPATKTQKSETTHSEYEIKYRPPRRGAPQSPPAGATRRPGAQRSLTALAPDHVALCATASPRLYWFAEHAFDAVIDLTITEARQYRILASRQIPAPSRPGIHRLDLAELGVSLARDTEYIWAISARANAASRADDSYSSGTLAWAPLSAEERAQISNAPMNMHPRLFAAAGYWHDAFDAVQTLRENDPAEASARYMERALLDQAGLTKISTSTANPR